MAASIDNNSVDKKKRKKNSTPLRCVRFDPPPVSRKEFLFVSERNSTNLSTPKGDVNRDRQKQSLRLQLSLCHWANPPHLLITYPFVYLHQIFDTKYLHSIHAKNIFSRRRKCFSKNKWKETCFLAKNLRDDGAFLDLLENPGFPGVRKIVDSWKDRCFTFDGASFTRIVAECYDLDPALLRSSILSSAHPRHV